MQIGSLEEWQTALTDKWANKFNRDLKLESILHQEDSTTHTITIYFTTGIVQVDKGREHAVRYAISKDLFKNTDFQVKNHILNNVIRYAEKQLYENG
jgi:hypothetical protein